MLLKVRKLRLYDSLLVVLIVLQYISTCHRQTICSYIQALAQISLNTSNNYHEPDHEVDYTVVQPCSIHQYMFMCV